MINVIHMQLSVAQEQLPREFLPSAVQTCMNVLRELQRESYDELSRWRDKSVESIAAIVNDNERMQEKCDEFNDLIASLHLPEEKETYLTLILDEVSSEYISLAVAAVNFLVR